jgi:hypothetical protein
MHRAFQGTAGLALSTSRADLPVVVSSTALNPIFTFLQPTIHPFC